MSFSKKFLAESLDIIGKIDETDIEAMADEIEAVSSRGGRMFILGVGGSAGHASHAVNDFRKIAGIECYAPTDNVSELTARVNDEGWEGVFKNWLQVSRLNKDDLIFVFSVGGGNVEKNVSVNLVQALQLANEVGTPVIGVVGRDGGFTKQTSKACCVIPTVNSEHITPHTEGLAAVVWHLLVSHPKVKKNATMWESTK